ncbi:MAG TPA: hypothetical protein VJ787_09775, partial [Thermoleophilia bacterium]|nr:hypothetical protein [Thermoleophilia bacterium]
GLAWTSFVRDGSPASAAADTGLYQPSLPSVASGAGGVSPHVRAVASAQKLVLYAILLYIVVVLLRAALLSTGGATSGAATTLADLSLLIALAALGMALVGVFRLASEFGYGTGARAVCLVLMFVPLVNLLTLLFLNRRAIMVVRAAGLRVGLLGVRW